MYRTTALTWIDKIFPVAFILSFFSWLKVGIDIGINELLAVSNQQIFGLWALALLILHNIK